MLDDVLIVMAGEFGRTPRIFTFKVAKSKLPGRDHKHLVLDESTHFAFLADVIPLRFIGQGQVISLGDVLLAVGLGRFLEHELRRPVRWFKHGAQAEAGSARRT